MSKIPLHALTVSHVVLVKIMPQFCQCFIEVDERWQHASPMQLSSNLKLFNILLRNFSVILGVAVHPNSDADVHAYANTRGFFPVLKHKPPN